MASTLHLANVFTAEHLATAWDRIRARRAPGGRDGVSIPEFDSQADRLLDSLREDVLRERYVPEPALRFEVPKASHPAERRALARLCVRDKVLQEAFRAALEPIAERTFADCSYAYRPGRGAGRAARRVSHHFDYLHHEWAASGDIDDFFGSLDQRRLLDQLAELGVADDLLRVVELWLRMGAVDNRWRWHDHRSGVPQGAIVSPLLANVYLTPFDRALTTSGPGLVRYADDFLLTAPDEATARDALAHAIAELARLGLGLNARDAPVGRLACGIDFLGIRFGPRSRRLAPDRVERCRRAVSSCLREASVERTGSLQPLHDLMEGWRRYYGRLLEPSSLTEIDLVVADGLVAWLRATIAPDQRGGRDAALAAVTCCTPVSPMLPDDHRRWAVEVVDRAFERTSTARMRGGPAAPRRVATAADRGHRATPSPSRRARRGAASASGNPEPPSTVVGRRRRAHLRAAAAVTELVVTTPGCFVGKAGDRVFVRHDRRLVWDAPVSRVSSVTVAAHGVVLSSDVMQLCVARGLPLTFIDGRGVVTATLADASGRGLSHAARQASAASDTKTAIGLASAFVRGKVTNQLRLLQLAGKYRQRHDVGFGELVRAHADVVAGSLAAIPQSVGPTDLSAARASLMGIEGQAARSYWTVFARLVPAGARFEGRERRGARDLVNCLLNYGYAVLQARVHRAILRAGLLPQVGFLHAEAGDRASLVFDLMEEFRPVVVDRAVLTMLHRREPSALEDSGELSAPTRQRLITRLKQRLAMPVRHRGRERLLEQVIDDQASAVVRHLDHEAKYRPFLAAW
jgi:CRISPR-associated endonuclease Cas1/group II intron reverse transcriptase/maturase